MNQEEKWLLAYNNCMYEVPVMQLTIRTNQKHHQLDVWLADRQLRTWAIITAWNPRSIICEPEQNEQANESLKARLTVFVLAETVHMDAERTWPNEFGFLIAGISKAEAMFWAEKYQQNAFVWGEIYGNSELILTRFFKPPGPM